MMMMRRRRTLVAVYVFATVGLLWASEDVSVVATASPGDVVRLHCYSEGSVTPSSARWSKDGIEVGSTEATPPGGQRLEVLADGTLRFRTVAEGDEGVYLCQAALPANMTWKVRIRLQVANVPATHPECSWLRSEDSTQVRLGCAWAGCYPDPALRWTQERKRDPSADGDRDRDRDRDRGGRVLASGVTSVLWVALNRSLLADGQTLRCAAQHLALAGGREATCTFTLEAPRPEVSPLAWAQEGDNVTLTCTEATSVPPADTAWWREAGSAALAQGPKYALSREGAAHSLTIANVSRDDGGVYFCRSENPLALHRAEVYLSVRASSDYTGAVIGVFVAALIVGLAAVVAKLLFANRHRVCLGGPFGPSPGDGGDVLNLVESDEEQIFQAAPRLPPITALVQIHPLPTGEQEGVANENGREEAPDLVTL
ncbi:V-set and immunoglobulin domain-containing protein 10 isoform X2 [Syngnathoides biaculeatus]|uniref:V-set and immunoglobulin domain-containing protein 10 isoform X2 n=1 Tax=Syngnathoides biaculeatus TaxID=300417 RepID=UPI002ADD89A8|nr:V-set and immunoglobulin domain-containing protein 10 isoform X2 [Syngnathoides biaculeatus]